MKTIICGCRIATTAQTLAAIESALNQGAVITEVVSGGCRGADMVGEKWGRSNGIPIKRFPPDWNMHGKAAGPLRNSEMAAYADQCIAVWDGESRGTGDMIRKARTKGMKIFIYKLPKEVRK